MKKFIIAFCGILIATNCLADTPKQKAEPKIVINDEDHKTWEAWKLAGNWDFNKEVTSTGNGVAKRRFMDSSRIDASILSGACGSSDEGAAIAIIATDIFENGNGAKFCMRQIQSANGGGNSWIDFYDTKNYNCKTFCKHGFYGDKCTQKTAYETDDTDYTTYFGSVMDKNLLETTKTFCDDTTKILTENTKVFHAYIDQNNHSFSQVVVLGVLDVKEHGILVGSVDIKVRRNGYANSWISSVLGNGSNTMLCAEGYKPNDSNDDCVEDTPDPNPTPNNDPCPSGKGFVSSSDHTCIACTGIRNGVMRNGVCRKCDSNEIFIDDQNKDYCTGEYKTYSKSDMRKNKCWMKTDKTDYENCINGD